MEGNKRNVLNLNYNPNMQQIKYNCMVKIFLLLKLLHFRKKLKFLPEQKVQFRLSIYYSMENCVNHILQIIKKKGFQLKDLIADAVNWIS